MVANGPWREKPIPRERSSQEERDMPYQLRSRGILKGDEEEELV